MVNAAHAMHDCLKLLAEDKAQEAITRWKAENYDENDHINKIASQYLTACLQKRQGQKDAAHRIIDELSVAIVSKACTDSGALNAVEEKIAASWVASLIERDLLQENLPKVAAVVAHDFDVEHQLSELYPYICEAKESFQATDAPPYLKLRIKNLAWVFDFTPASAAVLAFFLDWLPRQHNAAPSVEKYYRNFARYQKRSHDREKGIAEFVWDRLQSVLKPGSTMLDAGCGDALVTKLLLEKIALDVSGVDIVGEAGNLARANVPSINFLVADLEKLPHPDGSFDLVFASDVLEHTYKPAKVLRELYRLTRAGGYLFIGVPDGRFDQYIGHINFFSTQSLGSLVEELGGNARVDFYGWGIYALVEKPRGLGHS
jgi:SAM-dependent methyltransferase